MRSNINNLSSLEVNIPQPENKFVSAIKWFFIVFLLAIIGLNFFISSKYPDIFTKSKIQMASFNKGDSYSGRLNFW